MPVRVLRDIDWTSRSWNTAQAYSESKLHVTALALTLARVWPEVLSNAVIRAGSRPRWAARGNRRSADGLSHADMARRQQ